METYLRLLCVLSTLAGTGYTLSCTVCLVQGPPLCTGNNVTCPLGRVCGATHTINMEGGVKKSEMSGRSCVKESQCGHPGSFSSTNGKSRKGISCCYSDNCTQTQPEFLPESDTPNGLTCPSCTANGTRWCDTGVTIKCTGQETKCITQYSKMTGTVSSELILRGCATPSICSIGNESVLTDGISVEVQITCSGSSAGLHHHFHPAAAFLMSMWFLMTV
ncbi:phospholipase A2 inhibitor and Ly6/PLAUR domain-containing protein-like [Hyperolius riggenbachi]|uniref:phospholipase A2 inhibitor and Ly6/PLAUR domain-containing protein-like n=1 Tax=Hyperolius riggenbachi TaxID=752182 RepID=UPI0035A3445E